MNVQLIYLFQEIALILAEKMNFDVEKFLALCYDKNFIGELGFDFNVNITITDILFSSKLFFN